MALNTKITSAVCDAAVNAAADMIQHGTPTTPAKVVIAYNTPQPASPAAGTPSALVTINIGTASEANIFDNAIADGTNYRAGNMKAALGSPSGTAVATNTAQWFRAYNQTGTAIIDGSVGVGATYDMNIDNTSINSGQKVKITSWKIRMQYK